MKHNGSRKVGQGSKWIRPEKRHAIYHRDGHCCAFCGAASEDGIQLTLDHVISCEQAEQMPVARQRAALPDGVNDASNLLTACLSCNSAKQDLSTRMWFARLRARGIDTDKLSARIRRQLSRALDMVEGARLVALRKGE